jgi:hypothetical protein
MEISIFRCLELDIHTVKTLGEILLFTSTTVT